MKWSVLCKILLEVLTKVFGPLIADLFRKYLPKPDDSVAIPMMVSEAPDQLSVFLKNLLTDVINNNVNNPLVRRILLRVVDMIDDLIINAIWDMLFKKQAVGFPAPVKSAANKVGEENYILEMTTEEAEELRSFAASVGASTDTLLEDDEGVATDDKTE